MQLKKMRYKIIEIIGKITGCYNYGKNNRVIIIKNGESQKRFFMPRGLIVEFEGDNCTLTIEKPLTFVNTLIDFEGDNAEFNIGQAKFKVREAKFYIDENCKISIGRYSDLNNTGLVMVANNAYDQPISIEIGDNVEIARNTLIRASDGHTIINPKTKKPLNPPESITIEDNVWIGSKCVILKGAYISKGSIVGACSLVNKKFKEENVLLVGTPAKILKRNITWDCHGYGDYRRKIFDKLKN